MAMPPAIKNEFLRNPVTTLSAMLACFAAIGAATMVVVSQARWQERMESRVQHNEDHRVDRVVHMPYSEKVERFVTRAEWASNVTDMKAAIIRVESKVDRLLDKHID